MRKVLLAACLLACGMFASAASAEVVVRISKARQTMYVYADGQFVGSCPAVLKLKPGQHTVSVKLSGHRDWSREISVESGSEVRLTATLEQ